MSFRCGDFGHFLRDCPMGPSETRCYACRELGHIANDCPNKD